MAILVKEDIEKLTGCARKKTQIDALKDMKIPFETRPDGWPVTSSEQFNARLGGSSFMEDDINTPRFDRV